MMRIKKLIGIFILLVGVAQMMWADEKTTHISGGKGSVVVSYEVNSSGVIVKTVTNKSEKILTLKIDNKIITEITPRGTASGNWVCKKNATCAADYGSKDEQISQFPVLKAASLIEEFERKKRQEEAPQVVETKEPAPIYTPTPTPAPTPTPERTVVSQPAKVEAMVQTPSTRTSIENRPSIEEIVNADMFWGTEATLGDIGKINEYIEGIKNSDDKSTFIRDNDLNTFVNESESLIQEKEADLIRFVTDAVARSRRVTPDVQSQLQSSWTEKLRTQIQNRKNALNNLQEAIDQASDLPEGGTSLLVVVNYIVIVAIIALVVFLVVLALRKRSKKKAAPTFAPAVQSSTSSANTDIVVRRRTTSILKKQCIDDVKDNPGYKAISATDFCQDSAVKNIYVKNTCIKEIYGIYTESLRNPDRPKEDGCMVLGRWVQDEVTKTYDVTLEYVVLPGDDAVFKEYELNFGGKIKLRVADKLRKLRKETNLQYDLTCWVHSHPGLGVFFSNSDSNVQMQLKHAQHPNFLTAFVVDILTEKQEMGIFTFRNDGTVNSKQDLTTIFSLEELYQWAIESNRDSFSADNHYNVLRGAMAKTKSCDGIHLNNNAVIDLSQLCMESVETGLVGWAAGYCAETSRGNEFVVSSLYKKGEQPGVGLLGCLITVSHMSLPTIQRIISNEKTSIHFVLVCTIKEQNLTTIPVVNGEVINDERYFSEETLDNLKVWTRRRR